MGWEWVEIAFQIKGTETEEWFGSISSLFHSKVWNMMYGVVAAKLQLSDNKMENRKLTSGSGRAER